MGTCVIERPRRGSRTAFSAKARQHGRIVRYGDALEYAGLTRLPASSKQGRYLERVSESLLDGAQHLSDAEAYRRDRRKDRLLQQNGYLVLRFMAEDVGMDLAGVLDSILQSLAGRERSGSEHQGIGK